MGIASQRLHAGQDNNTCCDQHVPLRGQLEPLARCYVFVWYRGSLRKRRTPATPLAPGVAGPWKAYVPHMATMCSCSCV